MAPKERLQLLWRLDKLTEDNRNKINEWLDVQSNMQESLTNLVMHAIGRFGNTDIRDYEIQKAFYSDIINPSAPKLEPVEEEKQDEESDHAESSNDDLSQVNEQTEITDKEKEQDDWFEKVDTNNL